jgi:phosphotransferase system HPr (HPr) family protein
MKVTVKAKRDLDLSAAKKIAETAGSFKADSRLLYRDKGANAKSLMGIITLSYKKGAEIVVYAEGKDAAEAVAALQAIL